MIELVNYCNARGKEGCVTVLGPKVAGSISEDQKVRKNTFSWDSFGEGNQVTKLYQKPLMVLGFTVRPRSSHFDELSTKQ